MLVLLDLDDDSNDSTYSDTSEVAVEGFWELGEGDAALFNFFSEGHFVRESTSVQRNSSDNHVSSDNTGNSDDDELFDFESEESNDNGASDDDRVLGVSIADVEGGAEEESEGNTAPSGEASDSDGSVLLHGKSDDKSSESAGNSNDPLNGFRGFFVHALDSCEGEVCEGSEGDNRGGDEQDHVDQGVSSEAEHQAEDDHDGGNNVLVLVEEFLKHAVLESGATSFMAKGYQVGLTVNFVGDVALFERPVFGEITSNLNLQGSVI